MVVLHVGGNTKEKLKEHDITHVLAIHDTAEPQHPNVRACVYSVYGYCMHCPRNTIITICTHNVIAKPRIFVVVIKFHSPLHRLHT